MPLVSPACSRPCSYLPLYYLFLCDAAREQGQGEGAHGQGHFEKKAKAAYNKARYLAKKAAKKATPKDAPKDKVKKVAP